MHPAISETYELCSDIYHPFFDGFFASHEFKAWCGNKTRWRLHCFGGPGSGKTTLSALAVRSLREKFPGTPVISIFIKADVNSSDEGFVRDFLASVLYQLVGGKSQNAAAAIIDTFSSFDDDDDLSTTTRNDIDDDDDVDEARVVNDGAEMIGHGSSRSSLSLIREALHSRLKKKSCDDDDSHAAAAVAFLVLDDFDRCISAGVDSDSDSLLDREFASLQQFGLKILITSRLPVFEQPEEILCDAHNSGNLTLYWECKLCGYIMCYPCKEEWGVCQKCRNESSLVEPYEHVNLPIGPMSARSTREFVAWDLEREHGDLGLGSSNSRKPPLSYLGASLREKNAGNGTGNGTGGSSSSSRTAAQNLVERIGYLSHGNIAIAKLRLELVHREQTAEALETLHDRLPSNLLALFDAGMKGIIESEPTSQRELGLQSISVVCEKEGDEMGVVELEERLVQIASRSSSSSSSSGSRRRSPPPHMKDILRAARGFLVYSRARNMVAIYNTAFRTYICEHYNESLFWAHSQLHQGRIPRSYTFNPTTTTVDPLMSSSNVEGLDDDDADDDDDAGQKKLVERRPPPAVVGPFIRSGDKGGSTRTNSGSKDSRIFALSRSSTDSIPTIRRTTNQTLDGWNEED